MKQLKTVAALAVVVSATSANPARAQPVEFLIGDSALFNAADPNTVIGTRSEDRLQGLVFGARDFPYFRGFTTNGALSFELGSLSLDGSVAGYSGNRFTLGLLFYAPRGITGGNASPGNSATATAALTGSVGSTGGSVLLDFDNAPTLFSFSFIQDGFISTGRFELSLNDVVVTVGASAPITGSITNALQQIVPIPEPATVVLLGAGLAVLGIATRKRRA